MKKGFTLIELLTVIAIIGILATIVTVSTNKARTQARDAKRKADLNAVSSSLEMYYAQNKKYPSGLSSGGQWEWDSLQTPLQPYISSWSHDPKVSSQTTWKEKEQSYLYCCTGTTSGCTQYFLDASLESQETADISIADPSVCSSSQDNYKTGVYTYGNGYHYRVSNK